METETTKLLVDHDEHKNTGTEVKYKYGYLMSSERSAHGTSRHLRAVTVGECGAFDDFFPTSPGAAPKSYSISGDGRPPYKHTIDVGVQEMYTHVPFAAVFGLHLKEQALREAFASYAARSGLNDFPAWNKSPQLKTPSDATAFIAEEIQRTASPHHLSAPFISAVLVATLCQFCVGYNTGVMNSSESVVFPGHSTWLWSLAVSAFAMGGPVGAIAGGKLADAQGRRGALLIDIWIFLVAGIFQTFAPNMISIVVSRSLIGFASGFSSVLVPIYLGEIAPPNLRGALGTLTQFAMVVGIFVSNIVAFPLAKADRWRLLFAVTPFVAFVQLLLSPFLLESPRWILQRNPKSEKARSIIQQIRGTESDGEVSVEVSNYLLGEEAQHQDEERTQRQIIREMVSEGNMQFLLLSSLALQMSQQFSGINAVFYYSTLFFGGVIENPLVGTAIVGVVNVIATYGALLLMNTAGRKILLLWSSAGMFLSCIVIMMAMLGIFPNLLALVAVNTYVVFFAIGLGPIPWLIVAEMFEGKYVATAMSLCSQLNWACNFLVGLVFPFLHQSMGAFSFCPFAVVLAMTFGYVWFLLPETQGLTPEMLLKDLMKPNAARPENELHRRNLASSITSQQRDTLPSPQVDP